MNLSQSEREREKERQEVKKNMVLICFTCPGGAAGGSLLCLTGSKRKRHHLLVLRREIKPDSASVSGTPEPPAQTDLQGGRGSSGLQRAGLLLLLLSFIIFKHRFLCHLAAPLCHQEALLGRWLALSQVMMMWSALFSRPRMVLGDPKQPTPIEGS